MRQHFCCNCLIMKTAKMPLFLRVLSLGMVFIFLVPQSWAACGGGGGGGLGGMGGGAGSGGGMSQQTYQVPWKVIKPDDSPVKDGLVVYWFPLSAEELQKSSLRESRTLQLYSQQCVTMGIVDVRTPIGQKFVPDGKLPVAVLAQPDGTVVNKVENKNGKLNVSDLEKLLENEMKQRED